MKILFKIISAFLYFNSVSPVLMYYIYDDGPNVGFVALDNAIGAYVKPGFVNSKKQFTGSYNYKYQKLSNEHVVDSHFKTMKSPSRSSAVENARYRGIDTGITNAQRIVEEYTNTEAPKQWQQRHQQVVNAPAPTHQEKQHTQSPNTHVRSAFGTKSQEKPVTSKQQLPPVRPKAGNADFSSQMKQRNQRNQENIYEPKPNFLQMNVRKTQISTDPQKMVRLNNNRQMASLAVHGPQESRQRMPQTMMMDKTLHKTNGLHDYNMKVMTQVLDDMTQKISDRRHKKGEYRKRDTKKSFDGFEKTKRSVVSDNMRKYIGKDKSMVKEHRNNADLARIGSHEVNEMPYALFYRMNPETLDQQEGFMLMKENTSGDYSSKEKRLSSAFEEEVDLNQSQKSKKNGSALRLRKKLKNFSNFRNH